MKKEGKDMKRKTICVGKGGRSQTKMEREVEKRGERMNRTYRIGV